MKPFLYPFYPNKCNTIAIAWQTLEIKLQKSYAHAMGYMANIKERNTKNLNGKMRYNIWIWQNNEMNRWCHNIIVIITIIKSAPIQYVTKSSNHFPTRYILFTHIKVATKAKKRRKVSTEKRLLAYVLASSFVRSKLLAWTSTRTSFDVFLLML